MECTLLDDEYMGYGSGSASLKELKKLKNACRRVNGCFTLLWHNSEFETAEKRFLYQEILSD